MESGPLGDRQKMEYRAQDEMKGEETECQGRQLLFLQNDTLRCRLAMAWPGGRPLLDAHAWALLSYKEEGRAFGATP